MMDEELDRDNTQASTPLSHDEGRGVGTPPLLLSVIIPVYKVEQTLERCVQSVVSSLPEESEVILVDDESPDNCPQMCDDMAAADHRITVIHRSNGGLSAARNSGIDAARGLWITFVDSDDYVEYGSFRRMESLMRSYDFDIIEYEVNVYEGSPEAYRLKLNEAKYEDFGRYWLETRGFAHAYAWNKLLRRELFENVRFPEGQPFEDVPTTWRLVHRPDLKLLTTSRGLYHYMYNPDGLSRTADHKALTCLLQSNVDIFKQMNDEGWGDTDCGEYYLYMLNIQLHVYERGNDSTILLPTPWITWADVFTKHNMSGRRRLTERIKLMLLKLLGLKSFLRLMKH